MKRKWNILFALLAAAALVLAAGCSDGSSDAWSDEVASPDSGADSNVAGGDADNTGGDSGSGNASDAGDSGDNSGGDGGNADSESSSGDAGNTGGGSGENSGGDDSSIVSSGGSSDGNTGGDSGSGNASDAGGSSESAGGESGGGGGSSNVDSGTGSNAGGDTGNTGGDSGDGNASDAGGSGNNSGGEDAAITLTEITEGDVEELLQSIGTVKGNSYPNQSYWDFAAGTLETSDEVCTFTVAWVNNNNNYSRVPSTTTTLFGLQEKGEVSTDLLTLDLSKADWDEKPERESNGVAATTGTVKASIGLSKDASASHTIPESLQSVTIVLKSDVDWTISS